MLVIAGGGLFLKPLHVIVMFGVISEMMPIYAIVVIARHAILPQREYVTRTEIFAFQCMYAL